MWDWMTPSKDLRTYEKIKKKSDLIDCVLVPEKTRLDDLIVRLPALVDRCILLPNTTSQKPLRQKIENAGCIRLLHVGALGTNTYWKELLELLGKLRGRCELTCVGNVAQVIKYSLETNCPGQVVIHGEVPHQMLESYYSNCDIGLILYRGDNPNLEHAAPNKLYEYWSYGIPVICPDLTGLRTQLTTRQQGRITNFRDSDELLAAFEDLADQIREPNAGTTLKKWFDDSISAEKILPPLVSHAISLLKDESNYSNEESTHQ
jgi:glycosyltransferase involved in cell wall biosynthesis